MNTIAEETFANVRTVKAFSNEATEQARFLECNMKVLALGKKKAILVGIFSFGMTIIFWFTMGGICYYCYKLYVVNEITIGNILAYLNYMIMLMMNFGMIAGVFAQVAYMFGAADKLMVLI